MARIAILGTNTSVASATGSLSVTVGTAVPAGSLVVVGCAWENGATAIPPLNSVVDSRGNAYNATYDVAAGTGNSTAACALVSGLVSTPLQVSDTITLSTTDTRIRWAMQADAYNDPATSSPLDKTVWNHTPSSSASLTSLVTTTPLSQPRELVIGVFGSGVRTYTAGAGFTGGPSVDTAAGSFDRSLFMEYAYVENPVPTTAVATCTANTSVTYCGALATYRSWAPAGKPRMLKSASVRASRW